MDTSKIKGFENFSGAFKSNGQSCGGDWGTYGTASPSGFLFDASLSNKIYGNSDTVMPATIQLVPQIKY